MSTFCQDCGNELASQYKICPSCGSRNIGPNRSVSGKSSSLPVPPVIVASASSASPPVPTGGGGSLSTVGTRYAGFWRRVAAYFIDTLILLAVAMIIGAILGVVLALTNSSMVEINDFSSQVLGVLLSWAYFANLESSARQASYGKRVMGLMVCDLNGQRITFGRASKRFFSKILSGLILGIGYIMVAFTERNQGLHDRIADTVVLQRVGA